MWYQVSGADERTGAPRKVVVEADTEREAVVLAKAEGVKCKTVEFELTCAQCGEHTGWGPGTDAYMICSACRNSEQTNRTKPKTTSDREQRNAGDPQDRKARLTVGPRRWKYKAVQLPTAVAEVVEGRSTKGVAAKYLENLIEEFAAMGWEFYRIESVYVQITPGCLGFLFRAHSSRVSYDIAVFRVAVSVDEDK